MKGRFLKASLLAAVAAGVPAWASAQVVTVSPKHMQGWVIARNEGAKAELVGGGSAVYEREKAFVADDGQDLGKGAYYAAIGFEAETTPPSAWLGFDTMNGRLLAGTALKRITAMEYYAYNAHITGS